MQVGRHDGERNLQVGETLRKQLADECVEEFRAVDRERIAEAGAENLRPRDRARRHHAAQHLAAVMRERKEMPPHRAAGEPRRIAGADHRADRGAGDHRGLHAHLVERLDDRDVGDPARAAGAEREREGFHLSLTLRIHLAPACCANSQAVAASGRTICARAGAFSLVAVPSRTRPTMPCRIAARRKKL